MVGVPLTPTQGCGMKTVLCVLVLLVSGCVSSPMLANMERLSEAFGPGVYTYDAVVMKEGVILLQKNAKFNCTKEGCSEVKP